MPLMPSIAASAVLVYKGVWVQLTGNTRIVDLAPLCKNTLYLLQM